MPNLAALNQSRVCEPWSSARPFYSSEVTLGWITKRNAENVVDLWLRLKGRAMSRRAGYLILAAVALETDVFGILIEGAFALVNVKVTVPETPHSVSIVFASLAVILLLADRYLPVQKSREAPNPHDIALFKRFREIFDDGVVEFVRLHDFDGSSFDVKYFNAFNRISATWIGSRNEFEDSEMAEVWQRLFSKSRDIARLIAQNTNPHHSSADFCQPHWYDEDFHSDATIKKVKLMNDTATDLAVIVDELERLARKKWISTPA